MSESFEVKNLLDHSQPPSGFRHDVEEPYRPAPRRVSAIAWLAWRWFKRAIVGDEPRVRLTDEAALAKRKKMALSVGGILLLLLAVSVFFGWKRKAQLTRVEQVSRIRDRVQYAVAQASDLSRLQPARARTLLEEEERAVRRELEETRDEQVRGKLAALLPVLSDALATSGRVFRVEPTVFTDLGLVRQGTRGDTMTAFGDTIVVLDRTNGVVLAISSLDRSGEVIGGGADLASNPIAVALWQQRAYVLTRTEIIEIILSLKTRSAVVKDEGDEWGEPVAIGAFSGNLYLVDRAASELSRYPATDAGFGTKARWFRPGVEPDLTAAIRMAIDGDIWILYENGQVDKFRNGSPVGFRPSGTGDFAHPVALSVPLDGTRAWVLDQGNKRVVAVNRETGEYAGEWTAEFIGESSDLAVNEQMGKIFLLHGEKIYVIDF